MNEFTTLKGEKLKLRPVSRFMMDDMLSQQGLEISKLEIPMVEIHTVGGTETIPVTEKMLRDLDPEKLKAWQDYRSKRNEIESKHVREFLELIFCEGIDIEVPDLESPWAKRMSRYGLEVPEDEVARKMKFLTHSALSSQEEIGDLMAEIIKISGTDQEAVDIIKKSFRSAIQETRSRKHKGRSREVDNKQQDGKISGTGDSALLEVKAERIL